MFSTSSPEDKDGFFISRGILADLENKFELLKKNIDEDSRFSSVIYRTIMLLKNSTTDFEAIQKIIAYYLQIQVIGKNGNKQSYGEYLNQCIPPKEIEPYDPIQGEDLKLLDNYFHVFLNKYRSVSHTWKFDYPVNQDGEVITPGIATWKDEMIAGLFEKNLSIYDFIRNVTIKNTSQTNKTDEEVSKNIDLFCDELNETRENKALLAEWLKTCGGQKSFSFLPTLFNENHLSTSEIIQIGRWVKKNANWSIVDNQLTFNFSANIFTLGSLTEKNDCIYYKLPESRFIKANTNQDEIDDIFLKFKNNELDPLMILNTTIVLEIGKDKHNKTCVIPKIKKLELDCKASICITHSGKLLLENLNNNKELIHKLKTGEKLPVNLSHGI